MAYANYEDVAAELGRAADSVTPQEIAQWDRWLGRVERAIERAFRRSGYVLSEQIAASDPTEADVVDVEAAAVARKVQNPTWGVTSTTVSHQIDDGSGSQTFRNEGAGAYADPLELLDSELASLLPSGRPGTTSAFSVMPS